MTVCRIEEFKYMFVHAILVSTKFISFLLLVPASETRRRVRKQMSIAKHDVDFLQIDESIVLYSPPPSIILLKHGYMYFGSVIFD